MLQVQLGFLDVRELVKHEAPSPNPNTARQSRLTLEFLGVSDAAWAGRSAVPRAVG